MRIVSVTLAMVFVSVISIKAATPVYRDPGMKTIVQVAIVCRDIEATSKRWAALLGVAPPKISITRPGHEVKMIYRGKPSEGRIKMAFFETGTTILELLQPVDGDSSWQEILDANGEGVHHIAFKVMDAGKTVKTCESLGWPVVHQGRFDSDDGTYIYIDTKKDLGVTVELLNWDKDKK